jgi:hypothetical protein
MTAITPILLVNMSMEIGFLSVARRVNGRRRRRPSNAFSHYHGARAPVRPWLQLARVGFQGCTKPRTE